MKPRTYVAPNFNEALAQVKKDLGPEAVILSTRSRKALGAQGGRPHPGVEVKAALGSHSLADVENFSPKIFADAAQAKSLHQIQEDIREMKELFAYWLQQQGTPAWLIPHEEVAALNMELLNMGVARQILQRWLAQVQALVAGPHKSLSATRNEALTLLMDLCEVVDPWQAAPRPCFWTFQGPTGVGKTTTIAKLAVHFTMTLGKKVGLISLDGSRPGAYEPLAIYAKLIEAPFAAVNHRQELEETLGRWQDREIVLIDTPGQNPALPDIRLSWRNLFASMPQLQRCLVLSTTCSEADLAAAIEGFNSIPLHFAVLTKADEGRNISGLFNQLCHHRLPVAFLTTGQRVPEDIEEATRERIMELLLAQPSETGFSMPLSRKRYEQAAGA
jgi:flagellar biosynthesis protein FlhF